jgi:hypothetical protein
LGDAKWLGVVRPDPGDDLTDLGKAAVGHSDLGDAWSERAGQEPPQDFPFEHGRQDALVARVVEQPEQAGNGVEQLGVRRRGADCRLDRGSSAEVTRNLGQFGQQRGDRAGTEL